ncbi:MAG: M20/M25/M40 family metallo-hydrolase [Bacillota bacterium]|uniref:M20/M25/M40 family metallo-hydrolase n=1 Tax=Thermanaerosceptrum fracticalcis TaxID=1712410 RepID=UPI0013782AB7|nr:M20/M25/M40 family metallo-hydrolase [Thermanaerosceptrum fracticalcis]
MDIHGFTDIQTKLVAELEPSRTPVSASISQLAINTAREVYQMKPVIYPTSPGWGPSYLFRNNLGIPTVSIGIGYAGSQNHASNENIRIKDYNEGIKHIAAIINQFAEMK